MTDSTPTFQENSTSIQTALQVWTLVRMPKREDGILGYVFDEKNWPILATLELPWKNNQRDISCAPKGEYVCNRKYSERFKKELFMVTSVPNRDDIEIHTGNTIKDSHGCILLGSLWGTMYSMPAVINSQEAFKKMMALLQGQNRFTLIIKEA